MSEKRTKSDGFMLRFPDGMRDRIKAAADTAERSMNAEIVARLEESFTYAHREGRNQAEIAELNLAAEALDHEIRELKERLATREQLHIDSLAEIRRLRIDRKQFDEELERERAKAKAFRDEVEEIRQVLRHYVDHTDNLQRIEDQLRLLNERLAQVEKKDDL